MKNIKFTPGDTNYQWDFDRDSPFSKRNLTVFALDRKSRAKMIIVKKKYYEIFFSNEKEIYSSRNQTTAPKIRHPKDARYIRDQDLKGNAKQIHFSINTLLEHIIARLKENPQSLFTEVETIRTICETEGFSLPVIESFNRIKDWEEFLSLLTSIYNNDSLFKFELLLAAITQYSALCEKG